MITEIYYWITYKPYTANARVEVKCRKSTMGKLQNTAGKGLGLEMILQQYSASYPLSIFRILHFTDILNATLSKVVQHHHMFSVR